MSIDVDTLVGEPVTKAAWKKAAFHSVLCPSGATVGIRIPDLSAMIENGDIPNSLIEVAIGTALGTAPEPSVELVAKQREFTDLTVMRTVVEPKLNEEDLSDIPTEDKEFLVSIATRNRDVDAEGNHIAGLDKSERFRRFRRIGEFEPVVEGA